MFGGKYYISEIAMDFIAFFCQKKKQEQKNTCFLLLLQDFS